MRLFLPFHRTFMKALCVLCVPLMVPIAVLLKLTARRECGHAIAIWVHVKCPKYVGVAANTALKGYSFRSFLGVPSHF